MVIKRNEKGDYLSQNEHKIDGFEKRIPGLEERPVCEQIEFILKIPRSLDQKVAEEINEHHRLFVEQEITRFSLALKDAERLSSEYKHASRRSREGAQENNERP